LYGTRDLVTWHGGTWWQPFEKQFSALLCAMQPLLALAALLLGAPYVRGQATCADKAAAKVLNSSNLPEPCVVPYTFTSTANISGYPLPTAWRGPAPVCYTQYYQNQLATPTFMPRNSTCSAYAHRGCCSSETVKRCAVAPGSSGGRGAVARGAWLSLDQP